MNQLLSKIEKKLKQGDWYRIVFLGDSITSTEWVYPNWRGMIEYVLKKKLEKSIGEWELRCWKVRCYNTGYNGASTKEIIKFIDEDIVLHKPSLVIFMDTYNDKYRDIEPAEHEKNLNIIFGKLVNITEDIVFTHSIARLKIEANKQNEEYMKAANQVVKKYKDRIQSLDLYSKYAKLDLKKFFTFTSENGNEDMGVKPGGLDFGHPNQLGNAYIAKILLREIFNIKFDPELYIKDTLGGKKYPGY